MVTYTWTDELGTKHWCKGPDDYFHREDGPALILHNGDKYWYVENQLHRLDGPACECVDGTFEWWYCGNPIPVTSQKEFEKYIKLLIFT